MLMVYKFSLISIGFFTTDAFSKERIVGGYRASIEDFPYQLSLRYKGSHICGAVLISDTVGLTAAHCIYKPGSYSIRAGSDNVYKGGAIRYVKQAIIHPSHNKVNEDYDIAILKFFQSLRLSSRIKPIKLPQERSVIPEGKKGLISGWGVLSDRVPYASNLLRAVEVPVFSWQFCQKSYASIKLTPRMFCAGYRMGQKDACQGDSGGPFVIDGVLYGLVSWGFSCAQPNYPGIYTNISALREYIKENSGI